MDYASAHKQIYDDLADEYVARDAVLAPTTRAGVDFILPHMVPNSAVLELGCGSGLAAKMLSDEGHAVTVVEISPKMIEVARRCSPTTTYMEGNFLTIELDTKFDVVFAFAFLHLFPKSDAIRVIKKAHSLLKDGGLFYATTTKEKGSKEGWEANSDYKNKLARYRKRWTQEEFEQTLLENGFKVEALNLVDDPFGKVWMDYVMRKV